MAVKKEENTPETPEVVKIPTAPEAVEAPAAQAGPVTQPENAEQAPPEQAPDPNAPQSLDTLASRHRVPAWQAAALNRFMGWEPGKLVPDAEYQTALASLNARRLGGGRTL